MRSATRLSLAALVTLGILAAPFSLDGMHGTWAKSDKGKHEKKEKNCSREQPCNDANGQGKGDDDHDSKDSISGMKPPGGKTGAAPSGETSPKPPPTR